jgi:intracellular septation protein
MKLFYDLFPLLLFFAAFKFYDIFVATMVAMVASVVQVTVYWWQHRRFETMHLITLGVILVFGGLTIIFKNDTFIKWKPTLVYWLLGGSILGSLFVGRHTLLDRMLGKQLELPPQVWRRLSVMWSVFFICLGALNLYVAFYYAPHLDPQQRQEIWVNFKVFWLFGLTIVFSVAQAFYMMRFITDKPTDSPS